MDTASGQGLAKRRRTDERRNVSGELNNRFVIVACCYRRKITPKRRQLFY
jgi:hypothetical protein